MHLDMGDHAPSGTSKNTVASIVISIIHGIAVVEEIPLLVFDNRV
jgi:hypothetical protein